MNSVRDEIRYHLCGAIEGLNWPEPVEIYKGWVENEKFRSPSITVLMGRLSRTPMRGVWASEAVDQNTVKVTFIQSRVTIPATLEIYTPNRTLQVKMMPLLRGLFYPSPATATGQPPSPGLELTLDEHLGAHARVTLFDDEAPDATEGGLFRARLSLDCEAHELTQRTYDKSTFAYDNLTE